jgi:HAD superfamily hydrolase (TIGR01458 family)
MNKFYLIDIEGTIVKDKSFVPIEGAIDWMNSLKSNDRRFVLVSNNTTHKPADLLSLLRKSGFNLEEENLVTCIGAALNWLKAKRIKSCFVIGTPQLKSLLNENRIETKEDEKAEAVLVGLDTSLDYQKLKIATNALVKNKAYLLALHENRLYKDEKGELSPSVGAVVKALEYACQKKAKIFGKPNPTFFREILKRLGAKPEECMMISDDPLSDLMGAKKLGMKTVFVTSGKYKDEEILKSLNKKFKPDFVYRNISQIDEAVPSPHRGEG